MIYLACPYSHDDPEVRDWRYKRVTEAAAYLTFSRMVPVYSPITQSHPIEELRKKRNLRRLDTVHDEYDFWINVFDLPFLRVCDTLCILMLPGWETSPGIKMEVEEANKLGIKVEYLTPLYDELSRLKGVMN